VLSHNQIDNLRTERQLLEVVNHPNLVKMHYAFQTKERLYFVMPFVNGGEMFHHLHQMHKFPSKIAKFYLA